MSYAAFETGMLNRTTGIDIDGSGDFDCVDIPKAYAEYLFPGVSWVTTIGYGNAKDLHPNPVYFTKVANDVNNPNQLPPVGAIMVFDYTPKPGYTNQFDNPDGHTGTCHSADSSGYTLLQQASGTGKKPWLEYHNWKYRPCLAWYIPIQQVTSPQGGADMITQATLTFIFQTLLGRAPDAGAISHYVGNYTPDFVINDVTNSTEHKQHQANLDAAAQAQAAQLAQIPTLTQQVADLTTKVNALTASTDDKNKVIANQQSTITKLQAQLTAQGNDSIQLNSLGMALQWLIQRLGLK